MPSVKLEPFAKGRPDLAVVSLLRRQGRAFSLPASLASGPGFGLAVDIEGSGCGGVVGAAYLDLPAVCQIGTLSGPGRRGEAPKLLL